MAKLIIKSDNITPFGGLYSIFKRFSASGLRETIDSCLGRRSPDPKAFTYSDVFGSLFGSYLCGGDCIEDVMDIKPFWDGHENIRIASSDTIGRTQSVPTRSPTGTFRASPLSAALSSEWRTGMPTPMSSSIRRTRLSASSPALRSRPESSYETSGLTASHSRQASWDISKTIASTSTSGRTTAARAEPNSWSTPTGSRSPSEVGSAESQPFPSSPLWKTRTSGSWSRGLSSATKPG